MAVEIPQKTLIANLNFRRAMRLSGTKAFGAVFDAKMRKHAGPLSVLTRPNELGFNRLGLSVSRKVGHAVRRNRIKRRLREAFRTQQHELPQGYDIVVVVRPHDPLRGMAEYARGLREAVEAGHRGWQKRNRAQSGE